MRKCLKILLLILLSQVASGQEKPSEKFTKKYNAAKTDSEKGECIYSSIPEDSSLMTTLKNFLSFFVKQNDKVGIDYIKLIINKMQTQRGEFANALRESFEILSRFKKRKDKYGEMWTYSTIADIFGTAKNYDTAVVYYKGALAAAKVLNDSNRYINSLNDIGYTYYQANNPDSGLAYAKLAVDVCYKYGWTGVLGYPLSTLGELYMAKGQYDTALPILRESSHYIIYDSFALAGIYNGFAECLMAMNEKDSALSYSRLSISIAERNGFKSSLLKSYENLYQFFDKRNMIDSSNKYFRLAAIIKDTLYSIEKLKLVQEISFNEQLRSQEEIQHQRAQQNRLKFYSLLFVLAFFLIVAIVLYRNNQQKRRANKILEQQKQEIAFQRDKTNDALSELRSTQSQLIQSEKMASLGELTAGIAHEIQNPLNFVNNFSEVNEELLKELKTEAEKGNLEEVKAIADDIVFNSEKINHHGRRADAIVKGMLQHSRNSSGQKEPTDINALAGEYLRLAYHGLRAKDKTFNALTKTDFDDRIGKINIIPQDIGRVILNLINNAFYAVDEKQKQSLSGYEPTVSVSTKKNNGKAEISVKDNGNGIPQKVLDKIFQPFFTTKPTGQGTGLGLSLSYDIVKAHNGDIKVNTKEGEGSDFVISLPVK